jgi:hypothetical protein
MDPLIERVVRRFLAAVVVPFKPKPTGPHETIGGRKYVLSTDGGPLGDQEDPAWAGDARIMNLGRPENKWRFLWVYDVDRKYVAMWRVTDGNDKEGGSDRHYSLKIVQLEKKGQLNRVTHQEFEAIEKEMHHREHQQIEALKKSIADSETDYQKTINRLAQEFFEKEVAPKIERAVEGVKAGAIPLGFEPFGQGVHDEQAKLRQQLSYTVGQLLRRELHHEKVEAYIRHHGVDPNDPNEDNQAVQWAIQDIQEEAYERFLPPR